MTFHDIRLALRRLVHDRSVSAIVILCLALGIGVNATLFSVIDGVLIQPLPFPHADRLVVLNEVSERRGIREAGVSHPEMQDIRERAKSLSAVAASSGRVIALSDRDEGPVCMPQGVSSCTSSSAPA
jgi:putative ABC transport system permease protein